MLYKFRIRKNTGPGPAPPEKLAYFFLVLIYIKIFENIYIIYRNKRLSLCLIMKSIFIKILDTLKNNTKNSEGKLGILTPVGNLLNLK